MRSFIKDVLSVGISKSLMIFFGLATSILTARYLGPEGSGYLTSLVVYPTLVMTFGSLGVRQATTYFLGKGIIPEMTVRKSVIVIWLISSFLSFIISFLVLLLLFPKEDITILLLTVLPVPFLLLNTYISGVFLGKNEIRSFNRVNWIPYAIICFCTAIFLGLLGFGLTGALLALVAGPVFMATILVVKRGFFSLLSRGIDWRSIFKLVSLGTIYATSLLIINLNYKVGVIMLDRISTQYEVGIYAKGSALTEYLWQIPMLLSTIVFARSSNSKSDVDFSIKVAQLLRVSILLIGIGCLVLGFLSDYVILFMFGNQFLESVIILRWLLPGVLILTIFKVMNMDLAGKGKPWISVKAMVPSIITNTLLNYFLIPTLGAEGAAVSATLSYGIGGFLFLVLYSKEVGISIKKIFQFDWTDFEPIVKFIQR